MTWNDIIVALMPAIVCVSAVEAIIWLTKPPDRRWRWFR